MDENMSEQVDSALQEHLSVRSVEEKRITELVQKKDHSKQRSANHTPLAASAAETAMPELGSIF